MTAHDPLPPAPAPRGTTATSRRRGLLAAVAAAVSLLTATAPATALPAAGRSLAAAGRDPRPPATMSAVGGKLLGIPGTHAGSGAGVPALPARLTARSWLVADADTGRILAADNPHWRLPPASTLKMLFADTVLPKFPAGKVHRVRAEELAGTGAGSSLVGIEAGLTYRVSDLWRGVFLRSGNDAVHVLAHMNGGIDVTVREMQQEAQKLGAGDTNVVSPDGYDYPGQLSSAYDLALFARQGLRNPDFRAYCSTRAAQFPAATDRKTGKRESFQIQNTDRLLGVYPGLIGVKNGYTTDAGNTFVGAARRGGHTLLVAVLHPGVGYDEVYRETATLLDWGFRADGRAAPIGTLVRPGAAHARSQDGTDRTAHQAPGTGAAGGGLEDRLTTTDPMSWAAAAGGLTVLLWWRLAARRRRVSRRRRRRGR